MKRRKNVGAWILSAVLIFTVAMPCFASTQDEINAVQAENEATVSSLLTVQERIEAIESQKGESEAYLHELDSQLDELTGQLTELQEQYSEKRAELDIINQDLREAEADEAAQRRDMALRIQYMYENSVDAGLLTAVFSAENFNEMLTRASNIRDLSSYDREMLEEYAAVCREVEEKRATAEKEQDAILELEEQSREKREEIQLVYESTEDEIADLAEEMEDSQAEEAALIASIQEQEAQLSVLFTQAAAQVAAADAAAYAAAVQQQPAPAAGGEAAAPAEAAPADPSAGYVNNSTWSGSVLTRSGGVNQGPTGKETYYNLNMSGVINIMRNMGNTDQYWVRDDGVKMLGDYVMVAADLETHPRGSIVESSLGTAIVCDTGCLEKEQLDVAVAW